MALQLSTNFKGIDLPQAYYKVSGIELSESMTEGAKTYRIEAGLSCYPDATKQGVLFNRNFRFEEVALTEVNDLLPSVYARIKLLSEFTSAIDI